VSNFKKDLILSLDIVAWRTVNKSENSDTNRNKMLGYNIRNLFRRDKGKVVLLLNYLSTAP
jgi:hypothetical protein